MSQIKEITVLNTVGSVRKAAEDAMRPVVEEMNRKMGLVDQKMKQVGLKMLQLEGIQKKMQRNQQSNRYLHGKLLEFNELLNSSKLQMEIDRQQLAKMDEDVQDRFRKVEKEKERQDKKINVLEGSCGKTIQQVNGALKALQLSEQKMQNKFQVQMLQLDKFKQQVNDNKKTMQMQFDQMKISLNGQLKQSAHRLQMLDMYEAEKQQSFKKFNELFQQIKIRVTQEQFEFYKQCNKKQLQNVLEKVRQLLEENLSESTIRLMGELPKFKEELKKCLGFQERILNLNHELKQMAGSIEQMGELHKSDQQLAAKLMEDHFAAYDKKVLQMQENIQTALGLEGLIKTRIDQYSDELKTELRAQSQRKSKELYEQIKKTFADKKEAERQNELQRIISERAKLFDRCSEMQQLGGKIYFILNNYSTKFTKMRSDNQLFEDRVNKELQKLQIFQSSMRSSNNLIGQMMAEMVESILVAYCIEIEEHAKLHEQILLTTQKDGVVYQKFANIQEKGLMMYRRKTMDPCVLRRAVAFSLLESYDKLMNENCCLNWNESSPSYYFKQVIQPIYLNLNERKQNQKEIKTGKGKETIEFSTIHGRQTLSAFEYPSRNLTSHHSTRNRYISIDSGQIFSRKSTRRVRGALNSSLGMN